LIATLPSQLVQVSGYLRQAYPSGSDFFLITDQGTFQLRLVGSLDLASTARGAITTKMYAAAAGSYVTVVAGVGQFNATMQMMLFNANDITIGAVGTDAQILAAVVKNTNLPAESNAVVANITLPTTSFLGTTIAWSSSNTDVISNTGVVTRPAAGTSDVEVILTYTFTKGVEVFEGTRNYTVLAEEGSGVVEPQLLYTYDFGASNQTGYTAGELTFTNADTSVATINKLRAQINTHTVDNGTPALVLAPISGALSAFAEFNLTGITGIKQIQFSLATWSATSLTNIQGLSGATFQLEYYNSETSTWVPLQTTTSITNILGQANATTYTTVTYTVSQPGLYRISYVLASAPSTTNTAYAVCVDNFKIFN